VTGGTRNVLAVIGGTGNVLAVSEGDEKCVGGEWGWGGWVRGWRERRNVVGVTGGEEKWVGSD